MLRSGRLLTGAQLAARLEISVRTLYRDVADLQANGILIEGEAGVGYTLRRDMDLPPMQFTAEETTALVLVRAWLQRGEVNRWADSALQALAKIDAVLPSPMRSEMDAVQMYAPGVSLPKEIRRRIDQLHHACVRTRVVQFNYEKLDGTHSRRRIWPVALVFWGSVWTMVTWCETRDDFRVFRRDRMTDTDVLEETFSVKRGQRLSDFLRKNVSRKDIEFLGMN